MADTKIRKRFTILHWDNTVTTLEGVSSHLPAVVEGEHIFSASEGHLVGETKDREGNVLIKIDAPRIRVPQINIRHIQTIQLKSQ